MKRLIIVNCIDEDIFYKFSSFVKTKIPNVITLNLLNDVFINTVLTNSSISKISYLKTNSFRDDFYMLYLKHFKYKFRKDLVDFINERDSPNKVIFLLCNESVIINKLKNVYSHHIVRVLKLNILYKTRKLKPFEDIYENPNYVIDIYEDNENLLEKLAINFITNLPIKFFI